MGEKSLSGWPDGNAESSMRLQWFAWGCGGGAPPQLAKIAVSFLDVIIEIITIRNNDSRVLSVELFAPPPPTQKYFENMLSNIFKNPQTDESMGVPGSTLIYPFTHPATAN